MNPLNTKASFRVLLADDHEVVRMGTATFLEFFAGCRVCAQSANGREALELAASSQADVAVIDLQLPGLNGLELTRQIRRLLPRTEVVILTGDDSAEMTRSSFEAGAKAFILKTDAATQLAEAVQMAAQHRFYVTPQAHKTLHLQKPSKAAGRQTRAARPMTNREHDVIQLLAEGGSNKEVGANLGISVKTVETHRAAIMKKLKFARFSDLVRYAIGHKIIRA